MSTTIRTVGLLSNTDAAAGTQYYRHIRKVVKEQLGDLSSPNLVLRTVNFAAVIELQQQGRWEDARKYLANVAYSLEKAGAQCVLLCAVTMHLVADCIDSSIIVPLIHVVDVTAKKLQENKHSKPLLLASGYTMEKGFYQSRMARNGVDVIVPDECGRSAVHNIIFNEISEGVMLQSSRDILISLINTAKSQGADSVILGCSELTALLDVNSLPLPGYDSTILHAQAAAEFAISKSDA
ncbi:hypothetical protein DASB73_036620 [Starmerella bacillaris]|uniref:Aspartate racemase n=1 Tax=Starmerella bacillaris TaxID=1247836 RepID=A0AAV5RQ95_STABA|nr:hypothetical protein DASB73_036620 [Starmerella bacillaris]